MALVQRSFSKVKLIFSRISATRGMSTTNVEKDIKKSVFISQSKDIYTNLALEDWLYRNFDLKNHHLLMLWQSDPCVVIGRHQNPWLEANLPELSHITNNGVRLARRNSGGGTVYHDNGNLNLTFFTPREHYNRKYNLEIITRSLFREYGLEVEISPREDLTVRGYKQVSGTASKLGRPNAYHHCTLLVKSNKVDLSLALQKQEVDIKTNATPSVKSKIMNLIENKPGIEIQDLIKAIGWEYMRTTALTMEDGGLSHANRQNGFQMINPTEQWFPGLNQIRDHFMSWDWCYGKTPKFSISKSFSVPSNLVNTNMHGDLKVKMMIESGKIVDVKLYIPPGMVIGGFTGEANVITSLIGHKFSEESLNLLELHLGGLDNDKDRFVTECLRQVVASV